MVYQIEEELYSDSDHSSVYTSEDEFEVSKNIQKRFKKDQPLVEVNVTNTDSESHAAGATPKLTI